MQEKLKQLIEGDWHDLAGDGWGGGEEDQDLGQALWLLPPGPLGPMLWVQDARW